MNEQSVYMKLLDLSVRMVVTNTGKLFIAILTYNEDRSLYISERTSRRIIQLERVRFMELGIQFFIVLLLVFIYVILIYRIATQKSKPYFRENVILVILASLMILINRFNPYINMLIGILNIFLLVILIRRFLQSSNE